MSRLDEIKYIFNIFEKLNLSYVLIRPLYEKELKNINDIDMILSEKSYIIFIDYLRKNNISFKCYQTYTLNKIMLKIDNFKIFVDINLNQNSFTTYKVVTLNYDLSNFDNYKFYGINIRILKEPYLFIHWTLHHILDKKSFTIGSVYQEYAKRYKNNYKLYLNDIKVLNILEKIFLKEAQEVNDVLKKEMFKTTNILEDKIIKYINKKIYKRIYFYHIFLKVKFGLLWRINKYVFKKYRPIKSCIR